MIVKIFNKLFGWEYVTFRWGFSSIIRRAVRYPSGVILVKAYDEIMILDTETMTANGKK